MGSKKVTILVLSPPRGPESSNGTVIGRREGNIIVGAALACGQHKAAKITHRLTLNIAVEVEQGTSIFLSFIDTEIIQKTTRTTPKPFCMQTAFLK